MDNSNCLHQLIQKVPHSKLFHEIFQLLFYFYCIFYHGYSIILILLLFYRLILKIYLYFIREYLLNFISINLLFFDFSSDLLLFLSIQFNY